MDSVPSAQKAPTNIDKNFPQAPPTQDRPLSQQVNPPVNPPTIAPSLSSSPPSSPSTPPLTPTPPPTAPPLVTRSPAIPPEGPEKIPVKKDINFLNAALFVLGPLFMVGAFAFSLYHLRLKPQAPETYVTEEGSPQVTKESIIQTLTNAPLNPTQATARCQSTGEEIVSGQPTSCSDPIFTWSGEKTRELGTKIVGYWVYFGEKNNTQPLYYGEKGKDQNLKTVVRPIVEGKLQETNEFKPTNLEKGKTYYLAISAQSDSKNILWSYGLTNPDTQELKSQAAEILFTFVYE